MKQYGNLYRFSSIIKIMSATKKIIMSAFIFSCILFKTYTEIIPRIVKIGVFPAAPLVMIKDGKPDGFFIELLNYFSHNLGWNIQYVEGKWSDLLVKLEKGEIDLLPAVGFTSERRQIYDFSKNPVFIDSGVLYTSPAFTLHTVFDLNGKRIAALKGSIFTDGFIDYIKTFDVSCDILLTKTNQDVMQDISDGKADAGVCIYSLGNELMKKYSVVITPINFSPIALKFAVPTGKNSDLLAGIDDLMSRMITDKNSFYSKAYDKWTSPYSAMKTPEWIWWSLAGLLVSGLILAAWSITLKRQVKIKTNDLNLIIKDQIASKEKIRNALSEKETLIKELFHRTKNTMQVISSIVLLQAKEFPDNTDLQYVARNTEDRIRAISLVHQMLYKQQNLSRISIKDYIKELSGLIMLSYGQHDNHVMLRLNIEDLYMLIDTSIPVGLILNELMSNSLKYAFPGNREGIISVDFHKNGNGTITLSYSDNGVGVSGSFDFRKQPSLGLGLIFNIGENQLQGKVTFKNIDGVQCIIEIPRELYKARI